MQLHSKDLIHEALEGRPYNPDFVIVVRFVTKVVVKDRFGEFTKYVELHGQIVTDVPGKARTSKVLLSALWRGPDPKHDEVMVAVIHNDDTRGDDPAQGALYVVPILPKITKSDLGRRGGHYAFCRRPCGTCTVPLQGEMENPDVRSLRPKVFYPLTYTACEKCGRQYHIQIFD